VSKKKIKFCDFVNKKNKICYCDLGHHITILDAVISAAQIVVEVASTTSDCYFTQ
jgi:hypothetical protein